VLYACDERWWDVYGEEARTVCNGEFWSADVAAAAKFKLNHVRGIDAPGASSKSDTIHLGGNGGYQAIGLAHMWGASRILLLGYDYQRTEGKTHWHGDHEGDLPNLGHLATWVRRIAELAADLRRRGVEVINCSRATAITCFARAPIEVALSEELPPVFIQGMQGLGDNIYQRPVLRELCASRTVYLQTPWPQLYSDLPIRCVQPSTRLRTQLKNALRPELKWSDVPTHLAAKAIHYTADGLPMVEGLCKAAGVKAASLVFDLPRFDPPSIKRRPYIVVRPATIRKEWVAASRNPLPEYIARAAEKLREHFHVVSVADLVPGEEWAVPPLPYADEQFHAGELQLEQLLGLVGGAAGVVGGVGWLVPAAVAYQTPMLLIYGGQGTHNSPKRVLDPRMDTSLIYEAIPDRLCMCASKDHACDKRIAKFDEHLERWTSQLLLRCGMSLAHAA
jgi:hypothetical protein